jgi:hypothetical protein
MKKINHKNDMPKWFDLKHYAFLNKLTAEEFFEEVEIRNLLKEFGGPTINKVISLEFENSNFSYIKIWKKLLPQLTGRVDSAIKQQLNSVKNLCPNIGRYDPCSILSVGDILSYAENIPETANYFDLSTLSSVAQWKMHAPTFFNDDYSIKYPYQKKLRPFWFSADLLNYTDEQIIESFKKKLKVCRDHTKIKKPTHQLPRSDDVAKMFDYRLFEYFDLMYWSELSQTNIKKSVLCMALWPGAEKGTDELKQTLIPFYNKIFTETYLKGR